MGGEIWAESVAGSGSTMHFTAHFGVPDQTVPVQASPTAPVAVLPQGHIRILLADDSEDNRFPDPRLSQRHHWLATIDEAGENVA